MFEINLGNKGRGDNHFLSSEELWSAENELGSYPDSTVTFLVTLDKSIPFQGLGVSMNETRG